MPFKHGINIRNSRLERIVMNLEFQHLQVRYGKFLPINAMHPNPRYGCQEELWPFILEFRLEYEIGYELTDKHSSL